jgi:hypothetical protein
MTGTRGTQIVSRGNIPHKTRGFGIEERIQEPQRGIASCFSFGIDQGNHSSDHWSRGVAPGKTVERIIGDKHIIVSHCRNI